jgi:AraC-like DNA-binding protein
VSSEPTIALRAIEPLLVRLAAQGIDTFAILRARNVDPALLGQDHARVPMRALDGLWDEAARLVDDDALGLHLAEASQSSTFGIFSYLANTSATWGIALSRIGAYFALLSDASGYELHLDKSSAIVRARDWGLAPVSRHVVELTLAVIVCYGRAQLEGFAVDEVRFPHPEPANAREHRRIFAAPIRFGAKEASIRFGRRFLDEPLRASDARLSRILISSADAELAELQTRSASWTERVSAAARESLRAGDGSLVAVAKRMGMAPRTVQRRLMDEERSYRDVLDGVRREAAEALLARDLGAAEVAALLGFSEAAAFHRSFKRWTGMTPMQFKQSKK